MTRAILFANATLTSIAGLRAIMLASHEPAGAPFRAAQRTTELAPMMSRRRSVRSPIFDVAPSLCFPPVECCNGVSPSQAAKSRPRFSRRRQRCHRRRDHRTHPWDAHEATRYFVFFGAPSNCDVQQLYALIQQTQHINQDAKDGARRFRNRLLGILHGHNKLGDVCRALSDNQAELGKMAT